LRIRVTTFPGWCDVTSVDELPLLGLAPDAGGRDPQRGRPDVEDAVTHLSECLAESGFLGTLIAVAKQDRGLRHDGDLVEITDAGRVRLQAFPPTRNEGPPDGAFGIRRLEHLIDVAEEAGYLGDGKDAANHPRPGLEAPEDCASSWHWHEKSASGPMKKTVIHKLRCAVYTRKSSEEGLEQEFNSLDAQREACEAYIASQKAEGWLLVPDRYDGGGISGATLERSALKRLLSDIENHLVDVVVVYKIDRLSRALMDFSKLVEIFDRNTVAFASVTQSFNTTTSMGRLTLNILLSFAQFEREVIGERIRDEFAASRKKGMWMGGFVPLGYRVEHRKLVIDEQEAATVRMVFERFLKVGSATLLARALNAEGVTTRRGEPVDKGFLYKLINNRVYVGEAVHKGTAYPGEHDAIISLDLWNRVHGIQQESPRVRARRTRTAEPALLKGLVFGPTGGAMSPMHTRKGGRLYRYYVSQSVLKLGPETCPIRRIAAAEIEMAVVDQLRGMLRTPEIIIRTWNSARRTDQTIDEGQVREALERLDPFWDELFLAEQARVIRLLVERVDVRTDGIAIRLRTEGLTSVIADLQMMAAPQRAA
jgi:site-specific DNA recombinase